MIDLPKGVYIGTSGWSYPDWEGIFYPRRKPAGFDELRYLAGYFNAVELNNTFYRPPVPEFSKRWVERTADCDRFHFTLKLWQRFTHEREEPYTDEHLDIFKKGIEPLAASDRLGGILMQFPWSFQNTPETREHVERLAKDFKDYRRFIEVRHKSWQNGETFRFFRENGLNWTNIDQPVSRTSVRPSATVTGDAAYVRLHGRNAEAWFSKEAGRDDKYNYLYSDEELDGWVKKIKELVVTVDYVYAFTNNHFRGQAPANALQIMSKMTGGAVDVPETLAETFPFLKDIGRGAGRDRTPGLF
jgi:uncharacterized protein YecE (DUF72 family)